jgi:hypothetical protein
MAVTNAEITAWLAANPKASDKTIASAMQHYGVSPHQMAQATGLSAKEVQSRYDAALAPKQPVQQPPANLGMGQFGDPFKYNQKNPYLDQMSQSVTNQVTENLNRNILPGISSAAIATGGYGGSRQGVVEANAMKDANQGLSNSLTAMRYGDYGDTLNRQLSKYGMDQGFYTAQRGQDLQQTGLGASIFQMGSQGMLGQGQGVYNLGLTQQQAPWQALQGFAGASQPYTGFGSTTQNQTGSGAAGFLGGAIGGSQLYQMWK